MVGVLDTKKLNKQQMNFRNEIGKHHWDLFVTLNFHRHVSIEEGHKLIREWDKHVSRKLNGRRYNKDQNQWSANFKSDIYEDVVENRLKKLKQLLDNNVISKNEYEEQRKKIIEDI